MGDGHVDDLFDDTAAAGANDDARDWTTLKPVWKVSEIALHLGRLVGEPVGVSTVRDWCEQRLLEAETTPGGHYRVRAEKLRTYLNGHPAPLTAAA